MSDLGSLPSPSTKRNGPLAWAGVALVVAITLLVAWRFLKGLEANVLGGDWDSIIRELKICAVFFGLLLAATSIWLATILRRVGSEAIAEERFPPRHDPGLHAKNLLLGSAAIARGVQVRRLGVLVGAIGMTIALFGALLVLRL